MIHGIILRENGPPQTLRYEPICVDRPQPGEVRLRHTVIGVNFHDVYVRSGLYKTLTLPGIPGVEAVGVVEEVGAGVRHLNVGDRVAYVTASYGAYAEERLIAAHQLVSLPKDVDDRTTAATLLKGLTVRMLLTKVHAIQPGDVCLVHAAAGGVGRLLCQWAARSGADVIGTAGSEEKGALALKSGCKHMILYKQEDFVQRVHELTDGRGVTVVYDSVGKDTFEGSLRCLAVRGHLVSFGQSSGAVESFALSRLAEKSSTLSQPVLFHYIQDTQEYSDMAQSVFEALRNGTLSAQIGAEFPLKEAAQTHRALEARATHGSVLLIP